MALRVSIRVPMRSLALTSGTQRYSSSCSSYVRHNRRYPSDVIRRYSSDVIRHSRTIMHGELGHPPDVLVMKDVPLPELGDNEILIKMVAASINPSDINIIQGVYGTKPDLPAVPGNEGVGVVEAVGPKVQNLKLGDHVLPLKLHNGTWRSHLIGNADFYTSVDKRITFPEACTLIVNPCTAYRMLKDFGLEKGDTVIQNGANSGVGQAVIQMAKVFGLKSVNVVREREDFIEVSDFLTSLGADCVLSDAELRLPETKELWEKKFPKPKLAIDCVAGKSATGLMRHLRPGGALVNYGGMSRQPITASVSTLIFKEISIHGFWFSQWRERRPLSASVDMIREIGEMFIRKHLQAPLHDLVKLEDFKSAVEKAMTPYGGRKQILVMDNRRMSQKTRNALQN